MLKYAVIFFIGSLVQADTWKTIVINKRRTYLIENEGGTFMPLHLENKEIISAGLIIDGDKSNVIKMAHALSFPSGDTLKIEIFDNTESFANSVNLVVLGDKYKITYVREIVGTDLVQTFEPIKSRLILNSLDLSKGSKIRGYAQFVGRCVSGCSENAKKVSIEGCFAVKIYK